MEAGGVACVAPSSALLADGGIVERTTEKAMSKEITRPPNSQPPPVSFARESAKEASARAPTDDDDFASILLGLSTSVVTPSSSSSPSFLQPRSVGSNLGAGGVASSRSPSLKSTATKSDRIPRSSSTPSLRDREEASSASSSPASSNVSSPPPSSPASRASSFSSPAPPQRSRETMRQAREEMATLLRVVSQNPRKLLDWERASQLLRGCVQRVKELLGKEYEDEHALSMPEPKTKADHFMWIRWALNQLEKDGLSQRHVSQIYKVVCLGSDDSTAATPLLSAGFSATKPATAGASNGALPVPRIDVDWRNIMSEDEEEEEGGWARRGHKSSASNGKTSAGTGKQENAYAVKSADGMRERLARVSSYPPAGQLAGTKRGAPSRAAADSSPSLTPRSAPADTAHTTAAPAGFPSRKRVRRDGILTIACEYHTELHARCPPNCNQRRPARPHPRHRKSQQLQAQQYELYLQRKASGLEALPFSPSNGAGSASASDEAMMSPSGVAERESGYATRRATGGTKRRNPYGEEFDDPADWTEEEEEDEEEEESHAAWDSEDEDGAPHAGSPDESGPLAGKQGFVQDARTRANALRLAEAMATHLSSAVAKSPLLGSGNNGASNTKAAVRERADRKTPMVRRKKVQRVAGSGRSKYLPQACERHKLLHARCPANCPDRIERDRVGSSPSTSRRSEMTGTEDSYSAQDDEYYYDEYSDIEGEQEDCEPAPAAPVAHAASADKKEKPEKASDNSTAAKEKPVSAVPAPPAVHHSILAAGADETLE